MRKFVWPIAIAVLIAVIGTAYWLLQLLFNIFQKEIHDAQTGVISLQQALSNMESNGIALLANP